MKKERKEESFIKQPYYKGGDAALKVFISKHVKYPEVSRQNSIEGDVYLKYDIDYKGNVIDTKIISGLDKACNEEASRVVKMLKFEVPKNPRKVKVTFHKNIRIHFHAIKVEIHESTPENESLPRPLAFQISYNVVTTTPQKPKVPQKQSITYSYSIEVKR